MYQMTVANLERQSTEGLTDNAICYGHVKAIEAKLSLHASSFARLLSSNEEILRFMRHMWIGINLFYVWNAFRLLWS